MSPTVSHTFYILETNILGNGPFDSTMSSFNCFLILLHGQKGFCLSLFPLLFSYLLLKQKCSSPSLICFGVQKNSTFFIFINEIWRERCRYKLLLVTSPAGVRRCLDWWLGDVSFQKVGDIEFFFQFGA